MIVMLVKQNVKLLTSEISDLMSIKKQTVRLDILVSFWDVPTVQIYR